MILTKEEQELIADLEKINKMTHIEIIHFVKHGPVPHRYFDRTKPLYKYFNKRFHGISRSPLKFSKEYKEWVKKLES